MTNRNLPTYRVLAERYGVRLCAGCDIAASAHKVGRAAPGVVHWSRRLAHRAGIGQFLAVTWDALHPNAEPIWDRLYQRSRWSQAQARELQVRVPAAIWDDARMTVRYIFAGHINDAPPDVKRWMHQRRWL